MDQQVHKHQTVALSMIVKDEEEVILRALKSVYHIVDYYCICDTGSSDNTVKVIRDYLKENNLKGRVYQRKWVNFAHNRTEAIERASGKCDYIMTLDADEVFAFKEGSEPDVNKRIVALPKLDADRVNCNTWTPHLSYQRTQFMKDSAGPWTWESPIHEVPVSPNENTFALLENLCVIPHTDGARAKDANRFLWDAFHFEKEVVENPEHWRAWFYLGQSYHDAGRLDSAVNAYLKCAENTGWPEEGATCYLRVARIHHSRDGFDAALPFYWKSYNAYPKRAEPIYEIVRHYRKEKMYAAGARLAVLMLDASPDGDLLFVENQIYDWKRYDEAAVCYYWVHNFEKSKRLSELALKHPNLPEKDAQRIKINLNHAEDAIKKQKEYELREGSVK